MHGHERRLTAENFFGPGGLLAEHMPGWEDREGQLDMARDVEAAIADSRNLIVEAGTGTGKTLAYLVPLVLAGSRAVVSTGTKNLQDQLIRKDVPFLSGVLQQELRVAVMKGRNNFLCLEKLAEQERKPSLSGLKETSEFVLIREWAEQTETGDRSDLKGLSADSKLWPRLDARREACTGRKCHLFEECFVTRMHQRAREADLIIVNHHLYFADLSLRQDDFGPIIPAHQTVVFDEAHEIEGIVGQYFGVSLSTYKFEDLARNTQSAAKAGKFASQNLDAAVKAMRASARDFFGLFDACASREAFSERAAFRRKHAKQYVALRSALEGLLSSLSMVKDHAEETLPLRDHADELRLVLRTLLADVDDGVLSDANAYPVLVALIDDHTDNFVYWIEKRGSGVFLQATPIEVAPILEERLFRQDGSAVLASATLAVQETFEYIRGRLGLHASNESVIPSHFDFRRQALLYLPPAMPDPKDRAFSARAASEIRALLDITRGRAFVLFTSYKQMREVHRLASKALPFPCLMQGAGSNAELLEAFRNTANCVLFATSSFWQGVDVPGEGLSCVIIDKLPFAVPSDPIVQARIQRIQAQGGSAFHDYQIPLAALALKQGFGRLIRSASDRGVLALLDNRVTTKAYGKIFLDSLPDYARTSELQDVRTFFGS